MAKKSIQKPKYNSQDSVLWDSYTTYILNDGMSLRMN